MKWHSSILRGPKSQPAFWLMWALFLSLSAADAHAAPPSSQHQFIFLIETSSGMADLRASVTNFVCEMIRQEFQGRIRPGETYAIWTFNERVRTNVFSPDAWFSHQTNHYAERAAWFLRSQKFEKKARMDRALSALAPLAAPGAEATIFLLTDGKSPLSGTPFDTEVNEVFFRHRDTLKETGKPFVVLLQIQNRDYAYCAVSPGDLNIQIPEREAAPSTIAAEPASSAPAPPVAEPTPPPLPEEAFSEPAAAPAREEPVPAPKPSLAPAVPPKAKSELVASAIAVIESRKNGAKPSEKTLNESRLPEPPLSDGPAAPSVTPVPAPRAAAPSDAPQNPEPVPSPAPAATETPAAPRPAAEEMLAVAAPPSRRSTVIWITIAAAALISGAWLLRPKRPTGPKPASLISQSLDRDQR